MADVGVVRYPSWESVKRRKAFKPDGISSSSATSEHFVCTQVGPVFPPCSRKLLS